MIEKVRGTTTIQHVVLNEFITVIPTQESTTNPDFYSAKLRALLRLAVTRDGQVGPRLFNERWVPSSLSDPAMLRVNQNASIERLLAG